MKAVPKRTQLAVDLRGNSVYTRTSDGWQAYFPVLDVRVSAATEAEARHALMKALGPITNHGTDEQKRLWQEFCQNNIIEIEMTDDEARNEDEAKRVAAALAEGKGPHFPALTPENFDEAIGSDRPTLVDFWAAWCQPCLQMVPVLESYQAEVGDRVTVASVDVKAHESLWQRFELKGIPTTILFRSGQELGRILGTRTAADLATEVEAFLSDSPPGSRDG